MMVTVPHTQYVGSYWRRKKVEPYLMRNPRAKLHTNLEEGTYVQTLHNMFAQKDETRYAVLLSMDCPYRGRGDVITTKTFRIYFEEVTDEAELGLIKLAEEHNE